MINGKKYVKVMFGNKSSANSFEYKIDEVNNTVMDLYLKSDLPEKSYFKAMAGCCVRGHINTAKQIFKDKINAENIDLAISEFEDFCKPKSGWNNDFSNWLGDNVKIIYEMLQKFKN